MSDIDRKQQEHVMRRDQFEDMLREFVGTWAPKDDRYERDVFQRELMTLMRDAMQYQSFTFGAAIESYAAQQLLQASMHPLGAIFKEPKS